MIAAPATLAQKPSHKKHIFVLMQILLMYKQLWMALTDQQWKMVETILPPILTVRL